MFKHRHFFTWQSQTNGYESSDKNSTAPVHATSACRRHRRRKCTSRSAIDTPRLVFINMCGVSTIIMSRFMSTGTVVQPLF